MARVAAVIPDLMFASKVQGMLAGAGHEVELVTGEPAEWDAPGAVDVVVVDLVSGGADGLALRRRLEQAAAGPPPRSVAVYSHVDAETRGHAIDAGFDVVVPRSRMMREGAELVNGLVEA